MEVVPLGRSDQLGDVPAPQLVGPSGQQLRLGVGRMHQLVAPLTTLPLSGQNAVHRALRGQIPALVQKGGPHLRGRAVDKAFGVQLLEHRIALRSRKRPRRLGSRLPEPRLRRTPPSVDRGGCRAHGPARRIRAHERGQLLDGLLDQRSPLPLCFAPPAWSSPSKSAETFPCTSMTLRAVAS